MAGGEYDDILEYDPEGDTMTTVGHMTRARSQHAISVVQAGDYLQWCQWGLHLPMLEKIIFVDI